MFLNGKYLVALILALLCYCGALAQVKKDSTFVGNALGQLRDSLHNYVVPNATITIYRVKDDEILGLQFTNSFGRFDIKPLPVGVPLRLIATYVGYAETRQEFVISPQTKKTDLKAIDLKRLDIMLKEVAIKATPPPLQMRGDTLEFNPAAFKMDTNAVVEDVLRKMPGVTIWGDGMITVNGVKINSLMVNGKNFFGSDNNIALQNIPKNSVDKVQVYEKNKDREKDVSSEKQVEMNIILKKDKQDGYFGKVNAGYGTQKRYAADALLSYFSPQTQVSLGGATNNVNKVASGVSSLLGNASYKGESVTNDYRSDFTRHGLNESKASGFRLSHSFDTTASTSSRVNEEAGILTADYFLSNNNHELTEQYDRILNFKNNEKIVQTENGNSKNSNVNQSANAAYNANLERGSLSASYNFQGSQENSRSTRYITSTNAGTNEESQNLAEKAYSNNRTGHNGKLAYGSSVKLSQTKKISYSLGYNFDLATYQSNSSNTTNFMTNIPGQDRYVDRRYTNDGRSIRQVIMTNLPGVGSLIMPYSDRHRIDLINTLSLYNTSEKANVGDFSTSGIYTPNNGLTNVSDHYTSDERPALKYTWNRNKRLDTRYDKKWTATVMAEGQFFSLRNRSQKSFQNLNRSYQYFIPSVAYNYRNAQDGEYIDTYDFIYKTRVTYPNIDQLAPLVDDANLFNIYPGNINLRPSYTHDVTLSYQRFTRDNVKREMSIYAEIGASVVRNNITDSVNYDDLGRALRYLINGPAARMAHVSGRYSYLRKMKAHQLSFYLTYGFGYSEYVSSINGEYYPTRNNNYRAYAEINYSYKNLNTYISEGFDGRKTMQGRLGDNAFYTWRTTLSTAYKMTKGIFVSSRIDFSNSKSSAADNIYYTIWNADMGYRFLKGANAEIKISALDLLRQNTAVVNYINTNSTTTGRINMLQQYFMVTLAYYPRKFGLKQSK